MTHTIESTTTDTKKTIAFNMVKKFGKKAIKKAQAINNTYNTQDNRNKVKVTLFNASKTTLSFISSFILWFLVYMLLGVVPTLILLAGLTYLSIKCNRMLI